MIHLYIETTRNPDFSGFNFYVEAGTPFGVVTYCEAYKLDPYNINEADVRAVQMAARNLKPGEWMLVWHEAHERPLPLSIPTCP